MFIMILNYKNKIRISSSHGETFYINFYQSILQFRDKRITLRIFSSKNTNLQKYDMKLKNSSQQILLYSILKFHIIFLKFNIFTDKNSQSDMFVPKLKNTLVKIDIKSFSVHKIYQSEFIAISNSIVLTLNHQVNCRCSCLSKKKFIV